MIAVGIELGSDEVLGESESATDAISRKTSDASLV
jgi:hypothetical protein